jgi:aspartate/methionine/tyrosine aminotransferase
MRTSALQVAESSGCSVDHWEVGQTEEGLMRFDPADLKRLITVETKLVVVNFPHNPTGTSLAESSCRMPSIVS